MPSKDLEQLTEERVRQIIREEIRQHELDKAQLIKLAQQAQREDTGMTFRYGSPFPRRGGSNG